jgi:hypothetical protein
MIWREVEDGGSNFSLTIIDPCVRGELALGEAEFFQSIRFLN